MFPCQPMILCSFSYGYLSFIFFLVKCLLPIFYLDSSFIFLACFLSFILFTIELSILYFLDTSLFLDKWFANIFSQCLICDFIQGLPQSRSFNFDEAQLITIILFMNHSLYIKSKNSLPTPRFLSSFYFSFNFFPQFLYLSL